MSWKTILPATGWFCLMAVLVGAYDLARGFLGRKQGQYLLSFPSPSMFRGKALSSRTLFVSGALLAAMGLGLLPLIARLWTVPIPQGWTDKRSCAPGDVACAFLTKDGDLVMSYEARITTDPWDGSVEQLRKFAKSTTDSAGELGVAKLGEVSVEQLGERKVGKYSIALEGAAEPTVLVYVIAAGEWHLSIQSVAKKSDFDAHHKELENAVAGVSGVHDLTISPFILIGVIVASRTLLGLLAKPAKST